MNVIEVFGRIPQLATSTQIHSAIEGAMKAFEAATAAVTNIHTFDVKAIRTSAAGKAFNDAELRVKSCFEHYRVEYSLPQFSWRQLIL